MFNDRVRDEASPATGRCSRRCTRPSRTSELRPAARRRGATSSSRRRSPRCMRRPTRRATATSPSRAEPALGARGRVHRRSERGDDPRSRRASTSIIGHSERRTLFGETDLTVNKKIARRARRAARSPIVCIGETLEQRDAEPDARRPRRAAARGARRPHRRAVERDGARLRAGLGDRHRPQRHARAGAGSARAHPRPAAAVVWRRHGGALPHPVRRQRQAGQHRRAHRHSPTSTARSSAAPASDVHRTFVGRSVRATQSSAT